MTDLSPTEPAKRLEPAGFWQRALATVTDLVLVNLLYVLVMMVGSHEVQPSLFLVWVHGILSISLWTFLIEQGSGGKTPGARVFKLIVTQADGSPLGLLHALARSTLFVLWASTSRLPGAVALFWAPAGLPWFTDFVNGASSLLTVGFLSLMSIDRERKSPLDVFSGTRVLHDRPTEEQRLLPATTDRRPLLRRATSGLTYLLIGVIAFAIFSRKETAAFGHPSNPRQLLSFLTWARANTSLLSPRVRVGMVYRNGVHSGARVPTMILTGVLPLSILESAKARDKDAWDIQKKLSTLPELTQGYDQLQIRMVADGPGLTSLGLRSTSRYMVLTNDSAATRYYMDHPDVLVSTNSVLNRYTKEGLIPMHFADELYVKKDWVGITHTVLPYLKQSNELSALIFTSYITVLGTVENKDRFFAQKKILNEWILKDPKSALPFLVRAKLEEKYAWALRGGDYAEYVDKTQWAAFLDHLQKALADLRTASHLDDRNPYPWAQRIAVERPLHNGPMAESTDYRYAMKRAPWLSEARKAYMFGLTPQWGGSFDQMNRFAKECEAAARQYPLAGLPEIDPINQQAANGKSMIAVYGDDANWAVIQRVYERILARYPQQLMFVSEYAWYAHTAGRYTVSVPLFEKLGYHYYHAFWKNLNDYNISRGYDYNQYAWIYLQKDQLDQGMSWLLKAADLNPTDAWPMAKLATCYQRKHNVSEAKKWAEKTLAVNPAELDRAEAQGVLDWARTLPSH